ncbi:MAG TPA: hypothetical protein VN636_15015 [Acidimicrobiia bacterium]|nr:hypothetical protein [Acidimicrobiia bacterium]
MAGHTLPDADRAALAFSLLPTRTADLVNRRLTVAERKRLREGLTRTRDATDAERHAAFRALATAVRNGMDWPAPAAHDEADCPFTAIAAHPRSDVVDILERVAVREPLEVAVTLCHLEPFVRDALWERLSPATCSMVTSRLKEVHLVSLAQTSKYASDINARLARSIRYSGRIHA